MFYAILHKAFTHLNQRGHNASMVFDSAAEKAGIDFDWEILSLQIPVDQPPKQWMYLPALLLLGMVLFMQRKRRAFTS